MGLRTVAAAALLAASAGALRVAAPARCSPVLMRTRYTDGDERRLSMGGSGKGMITDRFGGPKKRNKGRDLFGGSGVSRTEGFAANEIRQRNLEAYINSEEEPTDGFVPKLIAGTLLFTIFAGLGGVFLYYGGVDGLARANTHM